MCLGLVKEIVVSLVLLRRIFTLGVEETGGFRTGSVRAVQSSLTRPETVGLLGTGAQDSRLDFHTAPEL